MLTFEEHDKLGRKKYSDQLTKIIEDSALYTTNASLVIALDSVWGTGKTTFVEMWANELSDADFEVIMYNAWENDDWNDPLIPVVNSLLYKYSKKNDLVQELKHKSISLAAYIGKNIVSQLVKNKVGVDVKELKEELDTKAETEINIFNEFEAYKKIKSQFVDLLQSLTKDKKIIFFIDELDRCKPIVAVETLEIIKHFFNVPNIVFIFSLDLQQLSYSVATIYGQNMNSAGYLRRFFDLHFKIPAPTIREYFEFINRELEIGANEELENRIITLFDKLQLSLREMNAVSLNIKLLLNTLFRNHQHTDFLEVYIYLLMLKYKYPKEYGVILNERFLSQADSSTPGYVEIPEKFFGPSDVVNKFLKKVCNGTMFRTVKVLIKDDKVLEIDNEAQLLDELKKNEVDGFINPKDLVNNPEIFNLKINQYIERNLELFHQTSANKE